jgi:hypothetical protein
MEGKGLPIEQRNMRPPHGTVTITLADWNKIQNALKDALKRKDDVDEFQPLFETLLTRLVFDTDHDVGWILDKFKEFNSLSPVKISHTPDKSRLRLVFPDYGQTDNDS